MSGGHYDYVSFKIRDLAEQIDNDSVDYIHTFEDDQTSLNMKMFATILHDIAEVAHDLEWFMSGDTGEQDFNEKFTAFINKMRELKP